MASLFGRQQRNVRLPKHLRRRRDSDEEGVSVDLTRPVGCNVVELLWRACQPDSSRAHRLACLNALARLLAGVDEHQELTPLTRPQLIYCLRVPLLHEAKEVRAAGYRVLRYLVRTSDDVTHLVRMQIPVLMVRSLDLVLDNAMERLQSLRLARRLLAVAPGQFPEPVTRCLVAMAAAPPQHRDKLWMLTVATLTQLSISAGGRLRRCGGVHVLLRCVLDCYQPRAADAVLSALLGAGSGAALWPELSVLLAPLADPHYEHHALEPDSAGRSNQTNEEEALQSAQVAVLSVLRSWPGLLLLGSRHAESLGALIDSLHLNRPQLRRAVVDMLFELLGRQPPQPGKPAETVIREFLEAGSSPEQCRLHEGFVAEEGRRYLPHLGDTRPDLVRNHEAVLLYILLEHDLLPALVQVVVTADAHLSLAATLLIGDVLHRANEILPVECSRFSNCLPTLLSRTNHSAPDERTVTETVSLLSRLHAARRRTGLPSTTSIYLQQQVRFCGGDAPASGDLFQKALSDVSQMRVKETCMQALLDESQLMSSTDPAQWRWLPIHSLVKIWSTGQHGGAACAALPRLCDYLRPPGGQFSKQSTSSAHSHLQAGVMVELVRTLLHTDQSVCGTCCHLLESLLGSVVRHLAAVATAAADSATYLSANSLMTTQVQYFFLLIGCAGSSERGRALLDTLNTPQTLLDLTGTSAGDIYVRLIVSSVDYSHGEWAWQILERCIDGGGAGSGGGEDDARRLYCAQFLRVLARARCAGFARRGVACLAALLTDRSQRVVTAALSVLEEACDHQPYLEAVVGLQPAVLSLGDGGVLLFARLLAVPSEHRMFERLNFVTTQLDRWRDSFNTKYVQIVESLLNDSLTRHQRSDGGRGGYGRRTGERHQTRPVPLPHHLYGQLAQHRPGFDTIRARPELTHMIRVVRGAAADAARLPTAEELLQLKSALWALANVGRTGLGLAWLRDAGLVTAVARLAAGAVSLSARATAVLALGMFGSTPQGVAALAPLGWHCVCKTWTEHWIVDEEKMEGTVAHGAGEDRADVMSVCSGDSVGLGKERTHTPSESSRTGTGSAHHSRSVSEATAPPSGWDAADLAPPTAGSSTESLSMTQPLSSAEHSMANGSHLEVTVPTQAKDIGDTAPRRRLPSVSLAKSPQSATYPSEQDAHGYSTLQGVTGRLRRGDSHRDQQQEAPILSTGRRPRLSSLSVDLRLSVSSSVGLPSPGAGSPPDVNTSLLRASSRRSSLTTVKRYQLQGSDHRPQYIGIALPLDLYARLLTPPAEPAVDVDDGSAPLSPVDVSFSAADDAGVFEFHSTASCLRCFTLKERPEWRPRVRTDTESSTESSQQQAAAAAAGGGQSWLLSAGGAVDIPSSINSLGSATSLASHELSLATAGARSMSEAHRRALVRQELLRLLTSLSSGVAARAAEQSLLLLKQKFSGLLRSDLCLYSEVQCRLASCQLPVTARRFLQELFEDVLLEEAKAEPFWTLTMCRQQVPVAEHGSGLQSGTHTPSFQHGTHAS